ncbi:MAG: hypothetical protein ABEJ70_03485 [Halobacteriaceae archaeon]
MPPCAFCGQAVEGHDPVTVYEGVGPAGDPTHFCNYACLTAHADAEGLVFGATCEC